METKALYIVLLIATLLMLSSIAMADTNQTINVTSKSLVIAGGATPLYYGEFITNQSVLYVTGQQASLAATLTIYNNLTTNTSEVVAQSNYIISRAY
ncbi:MAG: hypothetical protein M0R80_09835 [Proteobacteria bacterium]|jgi:ABC-type nickel/cobalt efflux system permease component RcnA|nr:hypothetical protein [Pseudomonadota bacterium]